MQRFLFNQSSSFRHLVCKHFACNYGLNVKVMTIENWGKGELCHNTLYTSPFMDRLVMSNKVINCQYNLTLDTSKHSDIIVACKNIDVTKRKDLCITKQKIVHQDIVHSFYIGRKYKTPCGTINNAFGMPLCIQVKSDPQTTKQRKMELQHSTHLDPSKMHAYKRVFQNHLNDALNKVGLNSARRFLALDTEYLNDIYDSWTTFPEAQDHSSLFMIGICNLNKKYTNFTSERLNKNSETRLLKSFFTQLTDDFYTTGTKTILLHWSKAEITAFRKAVERNPELEPVYKSFINAVVFLDLMPIIKKTLLLKSYSLKYVGKLLLGKEYETTCQNGADVILGIIAAEKKCEAALSGKTLIDVRSVVDIMNYNQIDTELLIDIYKMFAA